MSWWRSALVGVGCAAAVLALRWAASGLYPQITGFIILLPGVIVAALAAGRVAGLTATIVALLGGWAIAGPGATGVGLTTDLGRVATMNFVLVGLFCTLVGASLRKTLARLNASLDDLSAAGARIDEGEERLRVISERAPVMLWLSDEKGRCIHLNEAQRRFWGLNGPEDFDFPTAIHPGDKERVMAITIRALQEHHPFIVEWRSTRVDGVERVLRTEASPRLDRSGRFLGLIGVNQDVTEARAAEAALRERESQLQAMVDQAAAGIVRSDLDGRILTANSRFSQMLGRSVSEVEGHLATEFTHPDDIDATRSFVADAPLSPGERQFEKRYLRPDGSVAWALLSVRVLRDEAGAPYAFMTVAVEITALKEAESQLRESEARFRLMADTAPSPVWMTNPDAEVEFVNAALVEFYGLEPESILGHVWKQAIHPDDEAEVAAVMSAARPDRLSYAFEARFLRADGAWRWMRIAVKPRFDSQGGFLGYVGMSFDVTETREALDALAAQERRQTFLLGLTDRLRDLATPEAIMLEVERALGAELGADRVGYGEVDQQGGTVSMTRDWTTGLISAQGTFRLEDFGAALIDDLAKGRLIRIADVREDPRTRGSLDVFRKLETTALMRAPLIRGGQLRSFLYAHASGVRQWTDNEVELLQEVADRTWTEVERTRAEAEVRESEERFRAIADTAPVLIWVTQQDRTRAFVNQAYVAFNGGSYEEARLADWRAVVHPADHERIISESLAGEATGQPFSMEARYLRHDGEYRWLKSFSRPRLGADGEVLGFVGVAFDVTDIRESQARLQESESRFRTVADSAPVQIWMTDKDGGIAFANRRYKAFFDVAEDALTSSWQATVSALQLGEHHEAFMSAVKQRDRYEGVMQLEHPTLGARWLRCEGIPRFDGAGHFQGYVGANIDVTEAKRAEEDLKRINELLEDRVGDALAEKAKAEADLMHAQRMEAVGRLTGGVAHDFNNLLTVVIGALDMMLKSPENAARQKKLGEAALAAARRGERLTHQLLAFSRRQALRPEATDLNALIRESEPLLRRALGEAVDFRLKLRRGAARVSVDPAQFEAALLNLVVNARDALGDSGRVTVQTQTCEVSEGEIPELAAGEFVCVSVSDNGAGMSPEVIVRVFEPFFTTKPVGKGTGLGLSQVYGFARQSGGSVQVKSRVGRGTEIRLYLPPLAASDANEPVTAPLALRTMAAGRRLLLVEDDPSVAAVARELLEGLGLEVRSADSGPHALELLRSERFDVMLTDVVMPGGMTGIELAHQSARTWPDMQIVLTSGYAGDDVDLALADAPWPFVRKPYSGEQLAEVLGDLPIEETA